MKGFSQKLRIPVAIILFLVANGCSDSEDDLEVSRDIRIENNELALAQRMSYTNDTLQITGTSGGRVAKDFELILEGEIASPEMDGKTLQAVAINNNGGSVFVSYAYAGDNYLGGVDYVTDKLVLKASIQYWDAEVNAAAIGSGYLYMVGATALDSPAYVERVKFNSSGFSLDTHTRTSLGSYTSTGVVYHKGKVFVTTGNDENRGGGLYQLDDNLKILNYEPLHDARWAVASDDHIVVAQGTPGTISAVNAESFERIGSFSFDGANTSEAKTTVDIEDDRIFIAGGEQGVLVYDLESGALLYSITFDEKNSVANAVTAENGLMFISNGTNVYVASYDRKDVTQEPEVLGKIEFEGELSANHVLYRSNRMFIASGMGGVKMVKVVD